MQLQCAACQKGKSTKTVRRIIRHQASNLLDTVHSDLCGPMKTTGVNEQKYICTLIDDHSRMAMVRSIPTKADAPKAILEMINPMETQTDGKVKSIKTDNGGDQDFLNSFAIKALALKKLLPTTVKLTR
jgi:hypothetical protein